MHCTFAGILNLMMLILVAANARLIVENLLKYGVLTSPANWLNWLVPRGNFPLLLCWPALALSVLIANGIEKLGAARLKAEKKVCAYIACPCLGRCCPPLQECVTPCTADASTIIKYFCCGPSKGVCLCNGLCLRILARDAG